ncbi:unnamed protein product, partial [Gulo gulo]
MVARRRKRGSRDPEQGIPSPPGYSAIPIKFSEKQQASHYLYVREHRVREGTKSSWPQKRTLFVLNVPPYCTEECLSRLFSPCGPVQSVQLQEKPDLTDSTEEPKSKFFHPTPVLGFQVAYVVFQKPGGVSAALVLKGPLLASTESHPVKSGIHKWISSYADSVPDPEALRAEVDTFMEAYDKRIAEEEAKAKEEEGVPDEEGWVKVTRRGRRPVLPRTEAASLRVLERERRKRARKELLNFYAWQHRETKMERKGAAQSFVLQPQPERRAPTGGTGTWVWSGGEGAGSLDTDVPTGFGIRVPACSIPCSSAPVAPCNSCGCPGLL